MSTSPVRRVMRAATVPAKRPIDHLRRCGSGLFIGNCVGTVVGILFLGNTSIASIALTGLLLIALSALFLSPWFLGKRPHGGTPAVARTIATKETVQSRLTREGVRVPVTVKVIPSGESFRSVVVLEADDAGAFTDPKPGTLYAVRQVEPGLGELELEPSPTPEQTKLMKRLRAHPRDLPNTRTILPMRRGPLDPHPWWATVELVLAALAGAGAAFVIARTLA